MSNKSDINPNCVPFLPGDNVLQPHNHRRTGKIARLANSDREALNQMLHDGVSYSDIIKKFGAKGCQLNKDNLSRWHSGGYQDWLQTQYCLDQTSDTLKSTLSANQNGLAETGLRFALFRLYTLLLAFNPLPLQDSVSCAPNLYPRLLGCASKLTSNMLKLEKHRLAQKRSRPR